MLVAILAVYTGTSGEVHIQVPFVLSFDSFNCLTRYLPEYDPAYKLITFQEQYNVNLQYINKVSYFMECLEKLSKNFSPVLWELTE